MYQSLPVCGVFKKKFSRAESCAEEITRFFIPLAYLNGMGSVAIYFVSIKYSLRSL